MRFGARANIIQGMDKLDGAHSPENIIALLSGEGPAEREANMMSPLVLAYVGDAVYDLYVRTGLVMATAATPRGLHRLAAGKVCAAAQAEALRRIAPMLTEEERRIYKRGRNSHPGTLPKHAKAADYLAATGLEALIGYLYLTGRDERLRELMGAALAEPPEQGE